MPALANIPFSILDLASVRFGGSAKEAFARTVQAAQLADRLGYKRFWLAEHHNSDGIASSAPPVLISHVAQLTEHIRVGSGGVMLPNHSPLVVAEQFGTLESLYPGRIDLGLGRAPGTDPQAARALRRATRYTGEEFPDLVEELLSYFSDDDSKLVHAYPGRGLNVPIWLLGFGFSVRVPLVRNSRRGLACRLPLQATLRQKISLMR